MSIRKWLENLRTKWEKDLEKDKQILEMYIQDSGGGTVLGKKQIFRMNCVLCNLRSKTTDKQSSQLDWICRKCMKGIKKHKAEVRKLIKR